MSDGYVKSTEVCFDEVDDLVTPLAAGVSSAWRRLGLPEGPHDCKVTLEAWMTVTRQVYYTISLYYDDSTPVFTAEGYSYPVRDADMCDWSEVAENGVWTAVADMVGEDAADRLTGSDLVRWMRTRSR